jgi:cytochrome c biogenesis protein CcdA
VAVSVGLADSLNPSTVGPALFLATGRKALVRVAQFMLGVAVVNLVAGVALTIGPGRLLLGLVPHPQQTFRHVIELVAGVALLAVAVALWAGRRRLARRELPGRSASGGSTLLMGASLAAVELPTAAPYFAVMAGISASSATVPQQVMLLTAYNTAFVAPLLTIIVVLAVAGDRADPWLQKAAAWLQRRWPVVLATLLLLIGAGLTIAGGACLAKN